MIRWPVLAGDELLPIWQWIPSSYKTGEGDLSIIVVVQGVIDQEV